MSRRVLGALLLALAITDAAVAQDFTAIGPPTGRGPLSMLEHALPGEARWALASHATRWWGLPELTTRAFAAQAPLAAMRLAAGLSQTGEPAIGWTTVGFAMGAVSEQGGGALRVAARRDRAMTPALTGTSAWGDGLGGEAGAGAWLHAAPGLSVWASAPQLFTRGLAPPLARPLAVGACVESGDVGAWAALTGSRPGAEAAERTLGTWLASGPHTVWLAARDGPWRGSGGVAVAWRGLRVACGVDTHPELDETVHLTLGWQP